MTANAYKAFVVPHDFSEHASAAWFTAIDLARHFPDAKLHLVHVLQLPTLAYPSMAAVSAGAPFDMTALRHGAREALEEIAADLGGQRPKIETHVIDGTTVDQALCDFATRISADLIVMGTHGRTGLAHVFLGSVAERTLRHAPCPVLTVRGPETRGAGVSE